MEKLLATFCKKYLQKTLQSEVKSKNQEILQLQSKINEMDKEKNAAYEEKNKKGEELIKKLHDNSINSMSVMVNEYYYGMDGAYSEAYGYALYNLYKKEGLENLVEILNNKDESTIEGITRSLLSEVVIEKDVNAVNSIIEKLNLINSNKLSNKKKFIVLRLLEQSFLAKSKIVG